MSNLKRRLERLERLAAMHPPITHIIFVKDGETEEEAVKKFLADHPQYKESDGMLIVRGLTDEEKRLRAEAPPSIPIKERAGR